MTERDYSPIDRCRDCGQVTRMIVHEQGIGDDGEPYRAIYSQGVDHSLLDCLTMQRLSREEWPTLW